MIKTWHIYLGTLVVILGVLFITTSQLTAAICGITTLAFGLWLAASQESKAP